MKTLELISLTLENFKGIKHLSITPSRSDVAVMGANATGKTSLADAWLWLLFNKDTSQRADFAVKPHEGGVEAHRGPDTIVEAEIAINGRVYAIQKKLFEKWPKQRGSEEHIYGGNETSYLIDRAPKRLKDWNEFVQSIVSEDVFKMLSSSTYFNIDLKWDKRREILFSMADDVSISDIISDDAKYKEVREILSKHNIDDARQSINYEIKQHKKELDQLPARIDELARTLIDIDENDIVAAKNEKTRLESMMSELDGELADASKISRKLSELHNIIASFEREKQQIERSATDECLKDFYKGREQLAEAKHVLLGKQRKLRDYTKQLESMSDIYGAEEKNLALFRIEYAEIKSEKYVEPDPSQGICPTCGQELPLLSLDELDSLGQKWQENQDKRLEINKTKGVAAKQQNAAREKEITELEASTDSLREEMLMLEARVDELAIYDGDPPKVSPAINIIKQERGIQQAKQELAKITSISTDEIQARKREILNQIQSQANIIARSKQQHEATARIKALEEKEREVSQVICNLEKQRNLLEKLVVERCNRMENGINELFPSVKWKLFSQQINGGMTECCECIIGDAPYPDANDAAKVNAGLEIIDVLGEHMGVRVPVFVDKAESINDLRTISAQTISLKVTEDRPLRVVQKEEAEVA